MRKQLTLAGLVALVLLGGWSRAAFAEDPWFDKYDHDHNHRWKWEEFRNAHRAWEVNHHDEKVLKDEELRARFNELDKEHHGWVTPEQVRPFHAW